MTQNQRSKANFRNSSPWKRLRKKLKEERKLDYITQKPLRAGWNLHHCNLSDACYTDISDENNFECLNKQTHEILHHLWRYYEKDPKVLERLKEVLDKMVKINSR